MGRVRYFILAFICSVPSLALAMNRGDSEEPVRHHDNWRRDALRTMRVAVGDFLSRPADLAFYRDAHFNALAVFDADSWDAARSAWNFKSEDEVRAETDLARANGFPLIVGLDIEPFASIPQATDDEIRARMELWKKYGDDLIVGVSPWYDDVFYAFVDVARQRHVYALIKEIAPEWYVFGMIGEFGFNATDDEVARTYDPAAFDHLIVLMYPFNVGTHVTGVRLDNIASSDPDGDMARYVDLFLNRMNERFFRTLRRGQLILLVVQAFYYPGDSIGHIPRAKDIAIMAQRGNEKLRTFDGQQMNTSAPFCCWGGDGSPFVGIGERPEWLGTLQEVNGALEQRALKFALP